MEVLSGLGGIGWIVLLCWLDHKYGEGAVMGAWIGGIAIFLFMCVAHAMGMV